MSIKFDFNRETQAEIIKIATASLRISSLDRKWLWNENYWLLFGIHLLKPPIFVFEFLEFVSEASRPLNLLRHL